MFLKFWPFGIPFKFTDTGVCAFPCTAVICPVKSISDAVLPLRVFCCCLWGTPWSPNTYCMWVHMLWCAACAGNVVMTAIWHLMTERCTLISEMLQYEKIGLSEPRTYKLIFNRHLYACLQTFLGWCGCFFFLPRWHRVIHIFLLHLAFLTQYCVELPPCHLA